MNTHTAHNFRANETPDSEEDLLDLYLSLPTKLRIDRFADTARAAQVVGLSVRTIQLWIETGSVRAITVGKKYQVAILNRCENTSELRLLSEAPDFLRAPIVALRT